MHVVGQRSSASHPLPTQRLHRARARRQGKRRHGGNPNRRRSCSGGGLLACSLLDAARQQQSREGCRTCLDCDDRKAWIDRSMDRWRRDFDQVVVSGFDRDHAVRRLRKIQSHPITGQSIASYVWLNINRTHAHTYRSGKRQGKATRRHHFIWKEARLLLGCMPRRSIGRDRCVIGLMSASDL